MKIQLKGYKLWIVAAGAVLLLAAVVAACVLCFSPKGYRLIQIYAVQGEARLYRESVGELEAYENLMLQAQDILSTGEGGSVRLKLDEDKYLLVEENSEIQIAASGDSGNSKTEIQLRKGAVTSELQNKLSETSSYQVAAPNSVMAVRGTVYRVEASVNEAGEPVTGAMVLEGTVAFRPVMEDGSLGEELLVNTGESLLAVGSGSNMRIEVFDTEDYSGLSGVALAFFQEIITKRGRTLSVTPEELEVLQKQQEAPGEEEKQETEIPRTPPSVEVQPEETQEAQPSAEPQTKPSSRETQSYVPTPTQPTEESVQEPPQEDDDDDDDDDWEPPLPKYFQVSFQYKGEEIAWQWVAEGGKVTKPSLQPALTGSWKAEGEETDFDFDNTTVDRDLVLEFVGP